MDLISSSIPVFFVRIGVEVWVALRQQRDLSLPAVAAAVVGALLAIAAGGRRRSRITGIPRVCGR